ncbi:MAG: GIY-YIG nuclease family protein, partial [Porphyromonas endodontalis]
MTLEEIKKILPTLPLSPGCYQYYNTEGEIIYVGKAKNLRRR